VTFLTVTEMPFPGLHYPAASKQNKTISDMAAETGQ